jgi:hypothetical protein
MNAQLLLEPLKVMCTATECSSDLHCFVATQKMKKANVKGCCRDCGVTVVDWVRVHSRDIGDAKNTIQALKTEKIRHHFWHVVLDEKAVTYASKRTEAELRERAEKILRRAVGVAEPFRDGTQTKREGSGNPIFYAQHATGACCRKCVEEWHGIERGRALTDEEIRYLTDLVMVYVLEKTTPLSEREMNGTTSDPTQ